MNISPNGNYVTTWSKLTKDPAAGADASPAVYLKNVNIINIDLPNKTFQILHSFLNKTQNGWIPQFTADESVVCFYRNPYSLNFFKLAGASTIFDFSKPLYTLDLKEFGKIEDFQLSPGKNPSVAVFIPGQKGNPAYIKVYSLPNVKSPADKVDCEPDQSAIDYLNKQPKKNAANGGKVGAYRPPHARSSASSSGTGRSLADLHEQRVGGGRSFVPGMSPSSSSTNVTTATAAAAAAGSESKSAQKNRRKRANKKNENESPASSPAASAPAALTTPATAESLVVGGVFSIEEKKIRNLLKKLRAIESLKQKQANNEHLEDTQVLKIQTEGAVRKELESLGWKGDE
ncbi:hypothetical protein PMKS-002487 [Pichia membranifaciens]|uniref:Eukaryotic translation initiation factor 2A n=1 Tax=Pichia membranifaciens TaxID=4926 RepID=A0A1Q2YHI2_9ASCO|nr:hypothetical protein PMKS-002487 [Pichia membranifaciens]